MEARAGLGLWILKMKIAHMWALLQGIEVFGAVYPCIVLSHLESESASQPTTACTECAVPQATKLFNTSYG